MLKNCATRLSIELRWKLALFYFVFEGNLFYFWSVNVFSTKVKGTLLLRLLRVLRGLCIASSWTFAWLECGDHVSRVFRLRCQISLEYITTISFPEAAILLVSDGDRDFSSAWQKGPLGTRLILQRLRRQISLDYYTIGDVKVVSPLSTFVLNALTLK